MRLKSAAPAWPDEPPGSALKGLLGSERVVIEPAGTRFCLDLGSLWAYRELLYFLVWRDIKVRYRRATMGAAWAIIQPLLMMLVFTVFFGQLAGIPSDGVPYAAFALSGLVPWTFLANGMTAAALSVETQGYLIKKVYFPRLLLPVASVVAGAIDFAVNVVLLLALTAYFRSAPTASWLLLLPLGLLVMLIALGVGVWFAALQARYRDVQFLIGFFAQFWMFATPIIYPGSLVSAKWQTLYALNPMVGVVEGFRWALLHTPTAPVGALFISVAMALLLLVTGIFYFRRGEYAFADFV